MKQFSYGMRSIFKGFFKNRKSEKNRKTSLGVKEVLRHLWRGVRQLLGGGKTAFSLGCWDNEGPRRASMGRRPANCN